MKYVLLLTAILTSFAATAKFDEQSCESTATSNSLYEYSKSVPAITFQELAELVSGLQRLENRVRAVDLFIAKVSDLNNIDGAIELMKAARGKSTVFKNEEAEVVYDIARFLPELTVAELVKMINATHYFKNKISAFDMLIKKTSDFEAGGAVDLLKAVTQRQVMFRDEEVHAVYVISQKIRDLTMEQLLNLVRAAQYTDSQIDFYESLLKKVNNINDFDSAVAIFKHIKANGQQEVDMLFRYSQRGPQVDADRLAKIQGATRTSRAAAKAYEYFKPLMNKSFQR